MDITAGYTCDICRELDNGNIETKTIRIVDKDNQEKEVCKECLNMLLENDEIKFMVVDNNIIKQNLDLTLWVKVEKNEN